MMIVNGMGPSKNIPEVWYNIGNIHGYMKYRELEEKKNDESQDWVLRNLVRWVSLEIDKTWK